MSNYKISVEEKQASKNDTGQLNSDQKMGQSSSSDQKMGQLSSES